MSKKQNIWALTLLASALAMTACQPKVEKKDEPVVDQTSTSEVQPAVLRLEGQTEKVPVVLAECEGNSCPEISIDRLQTNQFVLDGLIDQAILKHLKALLENTDQTPNQTSNQAQKQSESDTPANTAKVDTEASASDVVEVKTAAQLLSDQVQPYVNRFLALDTELKNLGAGHQISLSISPKILNSEGVLATVVLNTSSYLGGAHGASSQTYFNFDLKSQKQVELDHILLPKQKAQLNTLAHQAFKAWVLESKLASSVEDYEQAWKFNLTQNFYLGKQGLILQYAEYEIGPYIVGLPRLTIPYDQLDSILKPEYLPETVKDAASASETSVQPKV